MYSYLHWQCDMEDCVWSLGRKTHFSCVDTEYHNRGEWHHWVKGAIRGNRGREPLEGTGEGREQGKGAFRGNRGREPYKETVRVVCRTTDI